MALIASVCACAHLTFGVSPGYKKALEQNTRGGKVYHDFETRLIVDATYRGKRFFEAFLSEYAAKYRMSVTETESLFGEERERIEKNHQFLISLYTPVGRKKKLTGKDSPWKFYLIDSAGKRITPSKIEEIKADDIMQYFYPYIEGWSRIFIADFSKEEAHIGENEPFALLIAGPYGEIKLEYRLEAGETP